MANQIIVRSGIDTLNFYLKNRWGTYYMFTQAYTPGVYKYFRGGRSENEIRNFKKWEDNPRLSKTIQRLPGQIEYVMREYAAYDRAEQDRRRLARRTRTALPAQGSEREAA